MRIWVVNFGFGVEHAYTSLENAYNASWDFLLNEGYKPNDEDGGEFFEELMREYDDERYSGFEVDGVLKCWEVEVD